MENHVIVGDKLYFRARYLDKEGNPIQGEDYELFGYVKLGTMGLFNPNSPDYGVYLFIDETAVPGFDDVSTLRWGDVFDEFGNSITPIIGDIEKWEGWPDAVQRFYLRLLIP